MELSLPFSVQRDLPITSLRSSFLPRNPPCLLGTIKRNYKNNRISENNPFSVSCLSVKTVRSPSLDKHVVKQNKIRFVQKLQTLLLSKPKCYIPIHILIKCRAYLSLSKPRSILSVIHRYPTIFELFSIPTAPLPSNATKSLSQLCVRLLTPAAKPLSSPEVQSRELIVDRPLKLKQLTLRMGLKLKRHRQDFLLKFKEIPDVRPYNTPISDLPKESIEAEKRACLVVREVLGLTVEKRTLTDHLTHFRNDFVLSNKLRGMIIRHPELFYVSLKGQRDSVFLVEGFDDKGALLEKKETLVIKEKLMQLVRESKRLRRERKKARINNTEIGGSTDDFESDDDDDDDDDYDDGFQSLFEPEDFYGDDDGDKKGETIDYREKGQFWTVDAHSVHDGGKQQMEPW